MTALGQIEAGPPQDPPQPTIGVKIPVIIGLVIVVLFFVVFVGWAAMAPLGSAAIAPGVVSVEGNRKTIQHLEGGIVSEIRVRDGDHVKQGDVLIVLDATQANASVELVRGRKIAAQALEARLIAERDGLKEIAWPDQLLSMDEDKQVMDTIIGQENIFNARKKARDGQIGILKQRIAQYREEIQGLRGMIKAEDKQIDLIADEIKDVSMLVKKGLAQRPRLRSLQRNSAEIEGTRSQNVASIAQAKQAIAEAQLQINELTTTALNEAVQELRDVQSELFDFNEQERASVDILNRTEIRALRDGVIVNLQVHTSGGVIAPGGILMDIVPANAELIVEAKVDTADIDSVAIGLPAQITFPAFSRRNVSPAEGTVTHVSADSLTDERTGMSYYLSYVKLNSEGNDHIKITDLQPGMQAEVMITTGERTALEYFITPITRSFNRALREE